MGVGSWMGVIAENGGAVQQITQYPMCDELGPYLFSISPDGQWVVCNHASKSLMFGQLDTNTLQLVGAMDTAITFNSFAGIVWAPDSRTLLIESQTNGMCSWVELERTNSSPPSLRPIAVWEFPDFTIPLTVSGVGGGCTIHLEDWSPNNDFVALVGQPYSSGEILSPHETFAVPLATVNQLLSHALDTATVNAVHVPAIQVKVSDMHKLLDSAPHGTWRPVLSTYTIAERPANGLVDVHAPDGAQHTLTQFERWEVGALICRILWAPDGSFAVLYVCFAHGPDTPIRADQLFTYVPQ